MLLHREEAARAHEDPGLPRRPARHGDRLGRGGAERAQDRRQGHRQGQARMLGRRRGGDRLPRPAGEPGAEAREHPRHRREGRGLQGSQGGHGPEQGALRQGHARPDARRHRPRRRYLPRPVRGRRAQAGDGQGDGRQADHPGDGESRAGDPARAREGGPSGLPDRDRPLGLPEPGEQLALLPVHLPRRAGRGRDHDQRGDEARRRPGARGNRAGRALRDRGARVRRADAGVRSGLPDPARVRSPADHQDGPGGRAGRDGERRRDAADQGLRRLSRPAQPVRLPVRHHDGAGLRRGQAGAEARRVRRRRGRAGAARGAGRGGRGARATGARRPYRRHHGPHRQARLAPEASAPTPRS